MERYDMTEYNDMIRDTSSSIFQAVKNSLGGCCVVCGSKETLQIHHKRYAPDITIKDLMILCKTCHMQKHKTKNIDTRLEKVFDHIKRRKKCKIGELQRFVSRRTALKYVDLLKSEGKIYYHPGKTSMAGVVKVR